MKIEARLMELAGKDGGFMPLRTLLARAGGVVSLRALPRSEAALAIRKAAKELAQERKNSGKAHNLNKQEVDAWLEENCAAKVGQSQGVSFRPLR